MIIYINFPRCFRYAGIALFPFIFIEKSFKETWTIEKSILINHERIHLRQQAETLVIFFYVIYVLNYILNIIRDGSSRRAYRALMFEKEAYANQADFKYLKNRKWFGWLRA